MREQPIKGLVIEDRVEFRVFIEDYILKPNGFALDLAEDGITGLVKAQDPSVKMILLDYELPKLNGVQVLRRLRKEGIKTPVILMTSHGSEQLAIEVFQLGVQSYLIKPFDITQATEAMGEALQVTYLEEQKQRLLTEVMRANTAIGDSVNKAKRLQENAQGGQILISQETLEMVHPYIQVRSVG